MQGQELGQDGKPGRYAQHKIGEELFDLSTDIQETKNVAEQFPEIVKQAKEIMDREHVPSALPGFQFSVLGE